MTRLVSFQWQKGKQSNSDERTNIFTSASVNMIGGVFIYNHKGEVLISVSGKSLSISFHSHLFSARLSRRYRAERCRCLSSECYSRASTIEISGGEHRPDELFLHETFEHLALRRGQTEHQRGDGLRVSRQNDRNHAIVFRQNQRRKCQK